MCAWVLGQSERERLSNTMYSLCKPEPVLAIIKLAE